MTDQPSGRTTKRITRSDVRSATIHGLRQAKANPRSIKLTTGQRTHITRSRNAGR